MIIGLGIDAVEIDRFTHWTKLSRKSLQRIFSDEEIEACLKSELFAAQRFAVRFAMREAFFKAIQSAYPTIYLPFLTACTAVSLAHAPNGSPMLNIRTDILQSKTNNAISTDLSALISITHTKQVATVCVLLQV